MTTRSRTLLNAKGREAAFAMLKAIADKADATIERDDFDREIATHIYLNGAACMIILDADTARHDFFAAHWHFESGKRGTRLYRDGFDGHGYRAHHKATSTAEDLEDLCTMIAARLGWIAEGSAFTTETAST